MPPSMPLLRKILLTVIFICAALVLGIGIFLTMLSLRKKPERTTRLIPQIAVQVMALAKKNYQEYIHAYGQARAMDSTFVEPEIPGVILWISPKLESGQEIAPTEAVIRLDSQEYLLASQKASSSLFQSQYKKAEVEEAIALLKQQIPLAQKEYDFSKLELERVENLEKKQQASPSEADQQRLRVLARQRAILDLNFQISSRIKSLESLEEEIRFKKIQVEEALLNVKKCEIFPPYRGKIVSRMAQKGSRVAPGVKLFQILDEKKMEIPLEIRASYFGKIQKDALLSLKQEGDEKFSWEGKITRFASQINPQNQTFTVYAEIHIKEKESSLFLPGSFLEARIQGPLHKNLFVIPRSAFVGEKIFYLDGSVKETGVVQTKALKALFLSDVALVSSDLKEGDFVILTNVEEIDAGSKVLLIKNSPASSSGLKSEGAEK